MIIIKRSYYRNFDKSTTDSGRNELHSDENSQNKPQTTQSFQQRKNSGITVLDSVDETEDEEDPKTKNLAKYLGMKDGVSASISGQVILPYLQTHFSLLRKSHLRYTLILHNTNLRRDFFDRVSCQMDFSPRTH